MLILRIVSSSSFGYRQPHMLQFVTIEIVICLSSVFLITTITTLDYFPNGVSFISVSLNSFLSLFPFFWFSPVFWPPKQQQPCHQHFIQCLSSFRLSSMSLLNSFRGNKECMHAGPCIFGSDCDNTQYNFRGSLLPVV